jgi:hypothetical protein
MPARTKITAHRIGQALRPLSAAAARALWNPIPAFRCDCAEAETRNPSLPRNHARSQYRNSRNSLAVTISSEEKRRSSPGCALSFIGRRLSYGLLDWDFLNFNPRMFLDVRTIRAALPR